MMEVLAVEAVSECYNLQEVQMRKVGAVRWRDRLEQILRRRCSAT